MTKTKKKMKKTKEHSFVSHMASHAMQMTNICVACGTMCNVNECLGLLLEHSFASHIVPHATQMLVICVACGTIGNTNEWHRDSWDDARL